MKLKKNICLRLWLAIQVIYNLGWTIYIAGILWTPSFESSCIPEYILLCIVLGTAMLLNIRMIASIIKNKKLPIISAIYCSFYFYPQYFTALIESEYSYCWYIFAVLSIVNLLIAIFSYMSARQESLTLEEMGETIHCNSVSLFVKRTLWTLFVFSTIFVFFLFFGLSWWKWKSLLFLLPIVCIEIFILSCIFMRRRFINMSDYRYLYGILSFYPLGFIPLLAQMRSRCGLVWAVICVLELLYFMYRMKSIVSKWKK
mgnify:CR=1 FL=1